MLSALKPEHFNGTHVTAVLGGSMLYSRVHQPEIPDSAYVLTSAICDDATGTYDQHIFLVPHGMALAQDFATGEPYQFPVDADGVIVLPAKGRYRTRYIWPLTANPIPLSPQGQMDYILERRYSD
ncbi:MAG: hypothetical protein ABL893_04690 [Hyphomicrobium sp.]